MLLAALFWSSCGYVGEPLPPALHIPQRVADLSASERGSQIFVQFTLPTHTTESLEINKPVRIELRVGSAGRPFDLEAWEANAKTFADIPADQGTIKYHLPAAEWFGKDVGIGARIFGANRRTAGWSNLFTLHLLSTPSATVPPRPYIPRRPPRTKPGRPSSAARLTTRRAWPAVWCPRSCFRICRY